MAKGQQRSGREVKKPKKAKEVTNASAPTMKGISANAAVTKKK